MNHSSSVPFLDLVSPHLELEEELVAIFRRSLQTAGFIGGPMVENFEREFAAFCDAAHCVGVGSGTDALRFALMAAGVKAGDTVITVPNTFIATTEAISQSGATPIFVDVDARMYTKDPEKLRACLETECARDAQSGRLISRRTGGPVTAIVPVHLYGQMADMDPILELAGMYGLIVVEDACQAHGAEYFSRKEQRWRKAGSMGAAAAFSFYPGKNLGACGEAGAITTNDEQIARGCRVIRDHGSAKKYFHDIEGYNGRLDAIQAGILSVKLRRLADWNKHRQECARRYDQLLAEAAGAVVTPYVPEWSRPVYHLYVVRVAAREARQPPRGARGIGTGLHNPIPLHLSKAYASMNLGAGSYPVSEKAAVEILSLPMHPHLTADQQQRVAAEMLQHLAVKEAGVR
jgi:dTDP-4-amino-4,6-dideoxygalactose transaminase